MKNRPAPVVPEVLREQRQLTKDDTFRFGCHPGVPCFNRCCADVNIVLTPLDILGLARRLKISTGEFLDRYALNPITKDLKIPVVLLKMGAEPEKRCQFLTDEGCGVYEDRPWACRMYPVGMAIPPARAGEEPEPQYYLFDDSFCEGGHEGQLWTVDTWREDQGLVERDALEQGFREIVSHPWFIGGRELDPKRMHIFYTACYDLDAFRAFVFESTFLKRFELEEELVESLRRDDRALLEFSFRWLRFALFAEPILAVREDESSLQDKGGAG